MKKLFATLLALMTLTSTASAETLRLYLTRAPETFIKAHPEVEIVHQDNERDPDYYTTAELSGPMMTREFNWDVFPLYVDRADAHLLMEKGYLMDLSGSEVIRDAVARMHPAIAEQCMYDGKIYAVPEYFRESDNILMVNMKCWEEAGYTPEDIPQSFSALLDFIEAYVTRRENDPDLTINVSGVLDDYMYGPETYPRWLVTMLLDSYMDQVNYAGEPLRFNDPELESLLERTMAVSKRIYALEPSKSSEMIEPGLFGVPGFTDWTELQRTRVDLRIREDQPSLFTGYLKLTAVSVTTKNPELAIELVEDSLMELWPDSAVLVYADAEPVVNTTYEDTRRHCQNMIALIDHVLADDHTPYTEYFDMDFDDLSNWGSNYPAVVANYYDENRAFDLLETRENFQRSLEGTPKYIMSPEALTVYKNLAQGLYLSGPSVFDTTSESSSNFWKLIRQLTDGLISPHEFCQEADRIAWMMTMENQ